MKYEMLRTRHEKSNCNSGNSKIIAGMWNDFVNAKKRMQSEGPFLLEHLGMRRRVFDACLGTGADSIFLLKNGYGVTSNELDRHFIPRAVENSRKEGVRLDVVSHDWRELTVHLATESFDAVICLGNSLTYLFDRADQLRALRNFFSIMEEAGVLLLDVRNYEYMLREREAILGRREFRYSGRYVYCGTDKVQVLPVEITSGRIRLEFLHLQTRKKGHLLVYPFGLDELRGLLKDAGFSGVSLFSDYRPGFDSSADFYQFVCKR